MTNSEKYMTAFTATFLVDGLAVRDLKYQDISAWDSIGHMQLMTALEEVFGIELDIDDIIEFSSFETGKAILKKYDIFIG